MRRLFRGLKHHLAGVLSPSERGACARRPARARVEPAKLVAVILDTLSDQGVYFDRMNDHDVEVAVEAVRRYLA